MPTKHARLNVVLEAPLYSVVKHMAKKEGVSLSMKTRELIIHAIEYCEDLYWTKEANKRDATFSKKAALSHKHLWS